MGVYSNCSWLAASLTGASASVGSYLLRSCLRVRRCFGLGLLASSWADSWLRSSAVPRVDVGGGIRVGVGRVVLDGLAWGADEGELAVDLFGGVGVGFAAG